MIGTPASFARRLLTWYRRSRRDLPWRATDGLRPDPYRVFVSEAMLQQTQVATVIPYFNRFIERFPDFQSLAAAGEQEVLRLWQGLGYYSRARNLQAAARRVVTDFGGVLPTDVTQLRTLPGVGRYTAGAVASIAFDRRAPILDGNVTRVLCRLDAVRDDPRERLAAARLWDRAEAILPPRRVGNFNSALMELGATVCTPRGPRCGGCPVRMHCAASAEGMTEQIPPPRKARPTPLERRWVFCIRHQRDGAERWLLEQRPPRGRWAGMWQLVTIEADADNGVPNPRTLLLPVPIRRLSGIGQVAHALTHRRYIFDAYRCEAVGATMEDTATRRWVSLQELDAFPLPRPHLKIVEMLTNERAEARTSAAADAIPCRKR